QRGGFAAAGAFLDRAAGMTTDPARRAQLALAAARAKYMAGAPDDALRLLTAAQVGPLDDLGRARVDLLRAQLSFALSRGSDAVLLLLRAARRLEPLDAQLARTTYMDALTAAQFAGRLARNGGVREVAQAALAMPRPPAESEQAADLLLAGLAVRFTGGYAASVPLLKRALSGDLGARMSSEEELRWMWLASHAAVDLWDDEAWGAMAERHLRLARDTGAVSVLPLALSIRIAAYMFAGELEAATSLIEEVEVAVEATGSQLAPYGRLLVAAWQGQEGEVSRLITAIVDEVVPRGEGLGLTIAQWARALVSNGTGRYEEGVAAALQASEHPEDLGFSNWGLFELIVAGAHSGMTDVATAGLERLSEMTRASGTDWGLGVEAHARALLSDREAAEPLFREAIERLGRTHIRIGLARAHLNYGEWLRREGRRLDAREELRIAHDMFTSMSAEAWAGRAERELLATGEQTRKRGVETREDLTTQEAQVARLARDGLSNAEIGARMFISPRTVEYHLHKVFNKLGINSRNQLGRALQEDRPGALSV
ncbi:MAG TPA: LuxR C-terminal-related transcriptional regulator, partial [Solirubrobacteraceae bacterium]|nr:LuxR C-terminal-related transcriptional regulator [Solirubrobacteraceae bacterium]